MNGMRRSETSRRMWRGFTPRWSARPVMSSSRGSGAEDVGGCLVLIVILSSVGTAGGSTECCDAGLR